MSIEAYVAHFVSLEIQDSQSAAAISHIDAMRRGIQADVVGIIAEFNAALRPERETVKYSYGAAISIGHKQMFFLRLIEQPLRFRKPGDGAHRFASLEVDQDRKS